MKIIIPLSEAQKYGINIVGSKAYNLSLFQNKGFQVPEGFSITTEAYMNFLNQNSLYQSIDMELYRKSLDDMRWEEIWDASLRIRSSFLKAEIPQSIVTEIKKEINKFKGSKFSVRSSSPSEDSAEHSFAGIHESYINIEGIDQILQSIKLVWASLWSDRAILYRNELSLDSMKSSISVLIQKMEERSISGLAFSQDPSGSHENMVIEAVEGLCSELVDNIKEPEKWIIKRDDFKVIEHQLPETHQKKLLKDSDRYSMTSEILDIEKYFGLPVDVEWTGTGKEFTVLQVRPITMMRDQNTERQWYMSLTPHFEKLKKLSDRVENDLIPRLQQDGEKVKGKKPENLDNKDLAVEINYLAAMYFKWKDIYWNEFIPFAHGIRNFAIYYNDLVKPENPYEFMDILSTDELLASKRNRKFETISSMMNNNVLLRQGIIELLDQGEKGPDLLLNIGKLEVNGAKNFLTDFIKFLSEDMDLSYENLSFKKYPEIILNNMLEVKSDHVKNKKSVTQLEQKFYRLAGESRKEEAEDVLRIGRLSWKLRDDDNILLGVIENQLLIFLGRGVEILVAEKRLNSNANVSTDNWKDIYDALRDSDMEITLPEKVIEISDNVYSGISYRQLVGQPSSPGMVTGRACVINTLDDFSKLKSGEIMVVDAVEPQMTFLVSIAGGIVERRGGMLVHSSIIAREMGVPAVNGVSGATEIIKDGDLVTVNGFSGIVVLGDPEFDMERGFIES